MVLSRTELSRPYLEPYLHDVQHGAGLVAQRLQSLTALQRRVGVLAHAMPLCLLRVAHCAHAVAQRVVNGIEVLYSTHGRSVQKHYASQHSLLIARFRFRPVGSAKGHGTARLNCNRDLPFRP